MVRRLEHDGLVERRADPRDACAVLVQLTTRGAQIIEERHAARVKQLTSLLDRLPQEERGAIAAALPALAHTIELGRKAELPLHPLPSACIEQHTERPKEKE